MLVPFEVEEHFKIFPKIVTVQNSRIVFIKRVLNVKFVDLEYFVHNIFL